MHSTNIPYIYSDNALQLLEEFIKEMFLQYGNGIEMKILILGGSAMAIKHQFRGTVDLDCDIRFNHDIRDAIKRASTRLGIPGDFINQDVIKSGSYSFRLWEDAILVRTYGNVQVYLVNDLDQLCMKVVAGRKKDLTDIRVLSENLVNQCYYKDILHRIDYLYGGTVKAKQTALKVVSSIFKKYGKLK